MEYLVIWKIDIEAETPLEAALEARDCQKPGTEALHFIVRDKDGNEVFIELDLPDEDDDKVGK